LDVAFALDYLHNQCAAPLIHCDLKPSNILLDLDMTAYVTDFGLARFMFTTRSAHQDRSESLACLKGSIGYIPPGEIKHMCSTLVMFVLYKLVKIPQIIY
jgi:serine/threonine protein kinase